MPVLTLEDDGNIRQHNLGTMGGVVMPRNPTLENARFFCPLINVADYAVYVTADQPYKVTTLKGGYTTLFVEYLDEKFPDWKWEDSLYK